MANQDVDELFRRFVRRGDVGAVGELFDVTAPQLARVAWHLTHDATEVEDLVQATFLQALSSVGAFDVARPVMPWLLGILVNLARNARRASARRPDAFATEPEDSRTPEAELEQRELRQAVERAVAELPDTYRVVVATWLLEGASPREIALRTLKPASTVRVQLHRGLELLRSGLPASVAALFATGASSGRELARVRESVVARAADTARVPTPAPMLVTGAVLMTSKWFVAAAAVIIAALGVAWISSRDASEPDGISFPTLVTEPIGETAVVDSPESLDERADVASAPDPRAERRVVAPRTGWWLVGRVVGVSDTATARLTSTSPAGVEVDVQGSSFLAEISALFVDREQSPSSLIVRYDHPRFMPVHVRVDVTEQVDLDEALVADRVELHAEFAPQPATLVVRGRLATHNRSEVASAVAALCSVDERGRVSRSPTEQVLCREDGSFRVRSSAQAAHALALALPGWRPATRLLDAGSRGDVDLGEITLDRGEHLSGSAISSVRRESVSANVAVPHTGADIVINVLAQPWFDDGAALGWTGERFEWHTSVARLGDRGTFRLDGLAPRAYRLRREADWDPDWEEGTRTMFAGGSNDPVFVASNDRILLERQGCEIRLDIRADGNPVDRAGVAVRLTGPAGEGFDVSSIGGSRTDAAGHLVDLTWPSNRALIVVVSKEGWAPQELVIEPSEAIPGAIRVIELARDANLASLSLRPVARCALGGGRHSVTLIRNATERTSGLMGFVHKTFDANASVWTFEGLEPGSYRVRTLLHPPDGSWCIQAPLEVELASADSAERELEFIEGGRLAVTVRDEHAASARLALVDAFGKPVDVGWLEFNGSIGTTTEHSGSPTSVPIGKRIELAQAIAPDVYTLSIILMDEARTQREQLIELVPGKWTELVIIPRDHGN